MVTVTEIQAIQKCLSNSNFDTPNNIYDCLTILRDKGEIELAFYNIKKTALDTLVNEKKTGLISKSDYNIGINNVINDLSSIVQVLNVRKIKLFVYLNAQQPILDKFVQNHTACLLSRYGAKKEQWKPYCNKEDIDAIYKDISQNYPLEIEYFDEQNCDLDSIGQNLATSFLIVDFLSLDQMNCGNIEFFDDLNCNVFIPVCEDLTQDPVFANHYRTTKKSVFRRLNRLTDTDYSTPNFFSYTEGIGKLKSQIRKMYSIKYSFEKSIVGYDGSLDSLVNF